MSAVQTIPTAIPAPMKPRRRVVCSAASAAAIRRWKDEMREDRIAVLSPFATWECPICGEIAFPVLRVINEQDEIVSFRRYDSLPVWCPTCKKFAWEIFPREYGGWRNGADYKCAREVRAGDCPPSIPAGKWGECVVYEAPEDC